MRPVGTIASGVTAHVDERGTVFPVGARWSLGWWVGADDRWHRAEQEVAVRQRLVDDTPVVETSMRVPGGDVVQRAFGVRAGADDAVVVEFENQSAVPVALALVLAGARRLQVDDAGVVSVDRAPALWSEKAPARFASARDVESLAAIVTAGEAGTERPSVKRGVAALVLPLAHRTTTRVLLGAAPSDVPSAEQVVRGWKVQGDRGMRVVVPDAMLESTIEAGRRLALLTQDDALVLARYGYRDEAIAVAERVAPDVAASADRLLRARRRDRTALLDAADVLALAGEEQAAAVARRAAAGATDAVDAHRSPMLEIRDRLVAETNDGDVPGVALCRVVPDEWLGQGVEVHDAPTSFGPVSFAVRWHGDRPALLWEAPEGVRVTAPGLDPTWSSARPKGDALLAPVAPPGTPVSLRRQ